MLITSPCPTCIFAEFAMELLSSGHHSALTTLSSLCFQAPCHRFSPFLVLGLFYRRLLFVFFQFSFAFYSLLQFFFHYCGCSSTMVDLGSFLLGFHFLFFFYFGQGGSGVLSHGAHFIVYIEDIDIELDIRTLCFTWLGDGATQPVLPNSPRLYQVQFNDFNNNNNNNNNTHFQSNQRTAFLAAKFIKSITK